MTTILPLRYHQCMRETAPQDLQDLVSPYTLSRSLRSSSQCRLSSSGFGVNTKSTDMDTDIDIAVDIDADIDTDIDVYFETGMGIDTGFDTDINTLTMKLTLTLTMTFTVVNSHRH